MMILSRTQIRTLDVVPLGVFLRRIEALAKAGIPEHLFPSPELRALVEARYREAVALRRSTERDIAAYIFDKLQPEIDARKAPRQF